MSSPVYKSLTELIVSRAELTSDSPAVVTGIEDSNQALLLQSLTYAKLLKAVHRLAWHYHPIPGLLPHAPGRIPPARVIAVLTSSSLDELLLELALVMLGLTPLLLSVNNSVEAVVYLISTTKATHLIYGAKFLDVAKQAQERLHVQGIDIGLIKDQRFLIWGAGGVDEAKIKDFPCYLTPDQEENRHAVILHSSGSTGLPKAVYYTHKGLISNAALSKNDNGFSTLPIYHSYGHNAIFRCFHSGLPIVLYPPHLPLTVSNIRKVIDTAPPVRQCFTVPYVITILGETEEGTQALANFDVVGYSGAALPEDIGNRVTAKGANLLSIYGSTETGVIMTSFRDFSTDKDWNWLRPVNSELVVLQHQGGDVYEAVVKDGYPQKIESNCPDGSWETKDLFLKHEIYPDKYKYIGRLDDVLVQTLGEKTNPVPMELCICGDSPYVAQAVVFGEGRPQTGVLILPSELGKDLSHDELLDKVRPALELANQSAPRHSRLLLEMVGFLPYGTPVPLTSKMSIIRPVFYAQFKDLIDTIYERFDRKSNKATLKLELHQLEDCIHDIVIETAVAGNKSDLDKHADLFAFGVDSLQVVQIRSKLVRLVGLNGVVLGQNIVYEYPSISKLAAHIYAAQDGETSEKTAEQHHRAMISMVNKYSALLIASGSSAPTTSSTEMAHTVLLTGVTGALGVHVLAQLSESPQVRKIVCISRAQSHQQSLQRLKESLRLRKLNLRMESKLVSYAGNVNDHLLGLSPEEYEKLKGEVTLVIHNAWPVNFILSLDSFAEHIRGAVNLMNLCLSTSNNSKPATFLFSSSVSSRQACLEKVCNEAFSSDPSEALSFGYARSKWVTEKVCQFAAEKTALNIGVIRIGQLVGDTAAGVWNENDVWSVMFRNATSFGYLPSTEKVANFQPLDYPANLPIRQSLSWLPIDYASRAITEVVLRPDAPKSAVYHIVNPQLTPWSCILTGLAEAGVQFELVEPKEYINKLEQSGQDPMKNPMTKLLPFFREKYVENSGNVATFSTQETSKVAPSIVQAYPISNELVKAYVEQWRQLGFLSEIIFNH